MSQILSAMKRGIQNMIGEGKNLLRIIKTRFGTREKEILIPEAWLEPEQIYDSPMDWLFDKKSIPVVKNPVAREPTFSFIMPKRDLSFLRSNLAFKVKRSVMFFLLVACIISIVSFSLINPLSLLYYIPVTLICLDYLRKTMTNKRRIWLSLTDIEDEWEKGESKKNINPK